MERTPHTLDYATPKPPRARKSPDPLAWSDPGAARALRAVLTMFLLLAPLGIWGLFQLQRVPYRPPEDTGTFLGDGGIEFVRVAMWTIGAVWLVCAGWLAWLATHPAGGR